MWIMLSNNITRKPRCADITGREQEVLRGPFIYVIVLLLATVLYWRNNVVGLIAVSQVQTDSWM